MKKFSAIVMSLLVILSSLIVFAPDASAVPATIYIHVDSVNGGNPVGGANVTLVNQVVGTQVKGVTDNNGDLSFTVDLGTLYNPSKPDESFSFAYYDQGIEATVEHENYTINSKIFEFEPGQAGLIKGWVNITMEPIPAEEVISPTMLIVMVVGIVFAIIIGLYMYKPKTNKKKDKKS